MGNFVSHIIKCSAGCTRCAEPGYCEDAKSGIVSVTQEYETPEMMGWTAGVYRFLEDDLEGKREDETGRISFNTVLVME